MPQLINSFAPVQSTALTYTIDFRASFIQSYAMHSVDVRGFTPIDQHRK